MGVRVGHRHHFSLGHIVSAVILARRSREVEARFIEEAPEHPKKVEMWKEDLAYATGALFCSVGFLEAFINDLLSDVHDDPERALFKGLSDSERKRLRENEESVLENERSLHRRFRAIVELLTGENIGDAGVYQAAVWLIKLRNHLSHHQAVWIWREVGGEEVEPEELEHMLRFLRNRITPNPILPHNAFYPNKLLGYGCSEWAVDTALGMTDLFFEKVGIPPIYEHLREDGELDVNPDS